MATAALDVVLAGTRLLATLRGLQASDGPLRLAEALDAEAERIERLGPHEPRAIHIVSDFRRQDWFESGAPGKLKARVSSALDRLVRAGRDVVTLRLVNVGEPRGENAAVVRVAAEAAQPISGVPVTITVEARNFGGEERRGVSGELEVGDPANPSFRIPLPSFPPIPPGGSASVEVQHVFPAPGEYPLQAHIDEDRLHRDDRAFAVAVVRGALSVALVDGRAGADRFAGEAGFLAAALAPKGPQATGIAPDVVRRVPSANDLKARDSVIVLDTAELSEGERDALDGFVRAGGGLAFFLGSQVRPERYLDVLGDSGVFPAVLGAQVEAVAGARVDFGSLEHPTLAAYRGLPDATVDRISAARYFALTAGPGAQVVAVYADATRTPAIVERALGRGRIVVFNITANRDWTDWPTDPSYPILLQEWARHLAPRRGEARGIQVGKAIAWAPEGIEEPFVVDPRGIRTAAKLEGGAARFADTDIAGFYRAVNGGAPAPSATGGQDLAASAPAAAAPEGTAGSARWYAVNRPADESDLAPAAEGDLRAALAAKGLRFTLGESAGGEETEGREGDLWRWLALAAGLLLMVELTAACWLGRR